MPERDWPDKLHYVIGYVRFMFLFKHIATNFEYKQEKHMELSLIHF
jgi:hypothetical protein